ncbi:MAG TPA: glycoside hydrolase family 3 N-terminal domain-containing protein [Bryobacteraceae bacterium]|nr:glycoside hydrolase family 3 N-terminal domain-containing protein [Bryobacteraceae bacterium]
MRFLIPFLAIALTAAPAVKPAARAKAWFKQLTLREKAAQLVIVPFYGDDFNSRSAGYDKYKRLVSETRIGGLILLNRVRAGAVEKARSHDVATFLNRMQRLSKLPLLVGGDFERGSSMRLADTTEFPHAMAFGAAGDLALTRAWGAATAREARALGVHWVYAPVADVNNNPDNPIINIRSFGEEPAATARHVTAFIEGARSEAGALVLTTVKHFPGHGDTATDSHIGLGVVGASRERLDSVELVPFRAAIQAGVDAVMTAHLAVPALEKDQIPATVSPAILTGLLRGELGFKGIISTDAMDMQGLTKQFAPGEAAVRSLLAGADILLIPADPEKAVEGVVEAVKSGRISRERLDESVLRVLEAKARLRIEGHRYADLEKLADGLNTPEDQALAAKAARAALTLVRNEGALLPLRDPSRACFYLLSGSRFSTVGRDLSVEIRRRAPGARVQLLDPDLPAAELTAAADAAGVCETAVVASWVTASAYRGNVALAGGYPAFMKRLLATSKPVAYVSFGNPYLLRAFPGVKAYMAAFSTCSPSEAAVLDALLGQTKVRGRLPVSIPGYAALGDGLDLN